MYRQFSMIAFLSLIVFVLVSCNLRGPDLVPERRSGSQGAEGFCRRNEGNLEVRVRNQGNEDAFDQSTTIVVFSPGGPKSVMTSPMPAGSFTDVAVELPSACFNPDCDFTITVDSNDDVDESEDDNNTVDGICIG